MGSPVAMTRTGNEFVISEQGHEDIRLPEAAIEKSKTLQQLLASSEEGGLVPLSIQRSMLMNWIVFVSQQHPNDRVRPDIPTLVGILQVCRITLIVYDGLPFQLR